jgi:hypothetical protein
MRRRPSLFSFVLGAFAVPLAACSGKSLDAGSTDAGPNDAGVADTAPATPGTGTAGSPCEGSGECVPGLACIGFAVHPVGKPCEIVGSACTIACDPADESACAPLGPAYKCIGGCNDDFFCGATSTAGETTIEVTDASANLTTSPGDALFSIKLTRAPKAYAPSALMIDAGITGTTSTVMLFTHNDTNANGLLDVGETLDCTEPQKNVFDETTVGKTVNVDLNERVGGTTTGRAKGVWRP